MDTKLLILLNGAPRAGKNTVAAHLADFWGFDQLSLAWRLRWYATDLYESAINNRYDPDARMRPDIFFDDAVKDKPSPYLGEHTPREVLIRLSEGYFKPLFGVDFWAQQLAQFIRRERPPRAVVTDLGFPYEVAPLAATSDRTVLFRVYRPGFTYAGDSRGYVVDSGLETYEILAETVPELTAKVDMAMRMITGHERTEADNEQD